MANDTAVRLIHFYFNRLGKTSKKQIISRIDAYHGSTYLAAAITGVMFDHTGFDLANGLVHYLSAPNCYRPPEGMSTEEFCDHLIQEFEDKVEEIGPENATGRSNRIGLAAGNQSRCFLYRILRRC